MRTTLRRSCNACAKAKHGCDLATPRCSRCAKRKISCKYANEPLTSPLSGCKLAPSSHAKPHPAAATDAKHTTAMHTAAKHTTASQDTPAGLLTSADASFDPFDSYPPTRLPRAHAQRLIHHFLSSIAFQYYPLDLNAESNPFIVSWWPLTLADPALFHVSLQTASLDEELRAQKGFPISELLMIDSVSLVRQKVEDSTTAFRDDTLNSVVTLAAIEHGKGNIEASKMHIAGVKRMVNVRGGIDKLKRTSPLTARMVPWVSMLVTGFPQFQIQDDFGFGSGVGPILQWQLASTTLDAQEEAFGDADIDPTISITLNRLRRIFHQPALSNLTNTEFHDLTCFVVHKLLLLPPLTATSGQPELSECLRYAILLYMLNIHGTTYYSHMHLANAFVGQLKHHLMAYTAGEYVHGPLEIWCLSIGMATAFGTIDRQWFVEQAYMAATALDLGAWDDVLGHLESILWVSSPQADFFQQQWQQVLRLGPANAQPSKGLTARC